MKTHHLLLYYCLFLLLFTGCDKVEETEIITTEKEHYRVSVFYKKNNIDFKDIGSSVYIYFNRDQSFFFESKYEGDGEFSLKDQLIKPDLTYQIDINGYIDVETDYIKDNDFTVLVESNHIEGRLVSHYFTKYKKGMAFEVFFQ